VTSNGPLTRPTLHALAQRWTEGTESVTSSEFEAALLMLKRYLSSRLPTVDQSDVDDIAAEVIAKMFQLATEGKLSQVSSDGYFYAMARNVALDRLRRMSIRPLAAVPLGTLRDSLLSGDDDVAATFDALATAQSVQRALKLARTNDDQVAFKVVTVALDETERLGERPSNRAIASQLGISHTAVAKALARFRAYLESIDDD
jgi:DNA-directed RNA polymerase specialized sigma24 family protein